MTISYARDALVLAGVAAVFAGTWLVAGLGMSLVVLGVVLAGAGVVAEMRGGDA